MSIRPLRIGVNALYLLPGGVGGTEIYLRRLLEAMQRRDDLHEFVLFTNEETGTGLVPAHARFLTDVQPIRAAHRPARILWEQTGLVRALRRHKIDVVLNPGFTAPVWPGCPSVTVFHDLQHKRHPEHFRWFDLPFWKLLLWQAARTSTHLIAVSEATRADLLLYYRAANVVAVPHGVETQFFSLRAAQADPAYLLCVSTLHPHKNLERLLRTFAVFQRDLSLDRLPADPARSQRAPRLVLAGMKGFQAARLEKLARELGLDDAVEFTGWIPRERLYELFRGAAAFVYPSTFEGFGMPVLEALAAGLPTACSGIPVLREVAGDAALFFDPLSDDALVAALHNITTDEALRNRLRQEGPRRARGFTWEAAAAKTMAVLEEAAAQRSRSSN